MKKLLIMAAITGLSVLPSVAKAQEQLLATARWAHWRGPWLAVRLVWSRVVSLAIRRGRRSRRAGALKATGIIVMSIIADIRRDKPGFTRLQINARRRGPIGRFMPSLPAQDQRARP